MDNQGDESREMYKVVVNREGQYSIWFEDRTNPTGWSDVGKSGSKSDCLSYIEKTWTDMRPASIRDPLAGS